MAKTIGAKGNVTGRPERRRATSPLQPTQATAEGTNARIACWASLDRKLMTQVVPWVPYLSASNINVIRPEGHEVELRPVLGPARLRARGGQVARSNGRAGRR